MPRSKTGLKRRPVSEENLVSAAKKCTAGEMSIRRAAQLYNLSKTTLERHVRSFKKMNATEFIYIANNNTKQVFTANEEELLKNYLINAARLNYGLTRNEVRTFAYQYSIIQEKVIPNNWTTHKIAGQEWLRQFLRRHPDLSVWKPEMSSLASFNECNVKNFFTNYKQFQSQYNLTPDKIWNCAETEVMTVNIQQKMIGPTKLLITSSDCDQHVTLILAVNAMGNHIPPMMLYPTDNFKSHMLNCSPVGAVGDANPNGCSSTSIFMKFLKHFQSNTQCTVENPVILFLDNNDSHISIETIKFCLANGIILLTFPPHFAHKMQPLSRTVFGPLKSLYINACTEWMLLHPGKSVTINNVAELVGKVFPKALSISNILKGFINTGIYPVNENIFALEEIQSTYVFNRRLKNESKLINVKETKTNLNRKTKPASTSSKVSTPKTGLFPQNIIGTDAFNVP